MEKKFKSVASSRKTATKTVYVDICLSYRDKKYIEGETEKSVAYGIQSGLNKTGWSIRKGDLDDAFDYQTHSTAIQFELTVPKETTEKDIIKELSLKGLSVIFEKR